MARAWQPGDPYFGEYQTILYSLSESGQMILDTTADVLQDTDGDTLIEAQ